MQCVAWSLLCGAAQAQTVTPIGTFVWDIPMAMGVSGLEVSDDGRQFTAISDQGWILTGTFERSGAQIVGVTLERVLPVLGNDGLPVAARRTGDWADAEGLAIAADGTHYIAFERWAHVSRFEGPEATGQWIKDHPSFASYEPNRQLEALAVDGDGIVYTLSERPMADGFPIYRLDGDVWSITGHIQERDGFSIVGADFAPNGRLFILERKLVLGVWWQSRVRRLDVETPKAVDIIWTSERGAHHNLEGIALWRDDIGLRMTLVSDNNRDTQEPTQFVELRLSEAR